VVIAGVIEREDVLLFQVRNVVMLGITLVAYLSALYLLWWVLQRVKTLKVRPTGTAAPALRLVRHKRTLVGALVMVFVYFVWPTPWRHGSVGGMAYRLNPITRETEVFLGGRWRNAGNCGDMPESLRWRWRWLSGWPRDIRPARQDRQEG
jgi:hypothetical protein